MEKRLKPWENINEKQKLTLKYPISDMEKDLINKEIIHFSFVRWSKPHGYAVVKAIDCTNWHLHPESLIYNQ